MGAGEGETTVQSTDDGSVYYMDPVYRDIPRLEGVISPELDMVSRAHTIQYNWKAWNETENEINKMEIQKEQNVFLILIIFLKQKNVRFFFSNKFNISFNIVISNF